MIHVKFKIPKKNKIHILEDWLTNGHWALKRSFLLSPILRKDVYKEFRDFLLWEPGSYEDGARYSTTLPDMNRVIPSSLDGYFPATITKEACYDPSDESFRYVVLKAEDGIKVGIAPEYVPLLKCVERVLIKDNGGAIVLEWNGEIVGLVMPVRL